MATQISKKKAAQKAFHKKWTTAQFCVYAAKLDGRFAGFHWGAHEKTCRMLCDHFFVGPRKIEIFRVKPKIVGSAMFAAGKYGDFDMYLYEIMDQVGLESMVRQ